MAPTRWHRRCSRWPRVLKKPVKRRGLMSTETVIPAAPPDRSRGVSKVETEAIADDEANARRVRWVDWDSGFRGSGLRVGDRLVGDMGARYSAQNDKRDEAVGASAEDQKWARLGLFAGDAVTVMVERQGQTL